MIVFFSDYSECSVSKTCNWQFIRWKNKSHIWFLPTLTNDHVQPPKHTNLFNKVMNISQGMGGNKITLHMFFLLLCFLTSFAHFLSKKEASPVLIMLCLFKFQQPVAAPPGALQGQTTGSHCNTYLNLRHVQLQVGLRAETTEAVDGGTPWNLLKALLPQA